MTHTVVAVAAAAAAAAVVVVWCGVQACIVAEAYSLNISWGDLLFDKAVRDGSRDYVSEMHVAGHLTSEVFRTVVDKYVN